MDDCILGACDRCLNRRQDCCPCCFGGCNGNSFPCRRIEDRFRSSDRSSSWNIDLKIESHKPRNLARVVGEGRFGRRKTKRILRSSSRGVGEWRGFFYLLAPQIED